EVRITFAGKAQPEAARTVDAVIDDVLFKLKFPPMEGSRRYSTGSIGRYLRFTVPKDSVDGFATEVQNMADVIKATPVLQQQYKIAGILAGIDENANAMKLVFQDPSSKEGAGPAISRMD